MPAALITRITGQNGSYLAEFLLSKDYKIVGMSRRTSTLNFERIAHSVREFCKLHLSVWTWITEIM